MNERRPQFKKIGQSSSNDAIPLITLSELKSLGSFVRYQDIESQLSSLHSKLVSGYPLFRTRLKPSSYIDLLINDRWESVEYLGTDDSNIYYQRNSYEERFPLNSWSCIQDCVAPAGLFTRYNCDTLDTSALNSAKLSEFYKRSSGAYVIKYEVREISVPYICFQIYFSDGRGSSGWDFETFHIADHRIHVNGVLPHYPFYNAPIAVSHRWLSEKHPDPDGIHYKEFMSVCRDLRLLDCQAFFIDYCSLPQLPRTPEENNLFRKQLLEVNRYYQKSTIILTKETDDYETRAWCMFEMILSSIRNAIVNKTAMEGKLQTAYDLARSYVETSIMNFEGKQKFGIVPGRKISVSQFHKWASSSYGLNAAMNQQTHNKKESLLNWFRDHKLKSTNMDDISLIVNLLEELL